MATNSKRMILIMGMALVLLFSNSPMSVASAPDKAPVAANLYMDGKLVEYKKLKVNKRVENMIALRTIVTEFNMKLEWVTKNKEWVLSNADHRIQMKIDSTLVTVNSKLQQITTPPITDNGNIYLPLRFIVVASGGELHNHSGIDVYWVLSPDQNALGTALVLNRVDEVKSRLKDWKDATIPLGIDGTMPYIYAWQSLEMVKLLLDRGFPVNYQEYEYDNILLNGARYTLLHEAATYGAVDVVQYLLEQGADPNLTTSYSGWNALQHAIWGKERKSDGLYSEFDAYFGYDATEEDFDKVITLLTERMNQQ